MLQWYYANIAALVRNQAAGKESDQAADDGIEVNAGDKRLVSLLDPN